MFRMASTHTKTTVVKHADSFTVTIIPALEDNYMYLITDTATKEAAIVDPADPENVRTEVDHHGVSLKTILTTHHHWDHAGGNKQVAALYPGIKVVAGDQRADAADHIVKEGDTLMIGQTRVRCIFTPCHTTGHICYYVTGSDGESPAVFTGDTLFLCGCGKFFEGTAEEMFDNLSNKLGKLPEETKVYCGHEYSLQNLKFGLDVDPENKHLLQKMEYATSRRKEKLPVPPSTIAEEKQYNPFMRVQSAADMKTMRERKNNFK
ncbi:Hydroxyacylglutathione hydrolase, mitochondrial [Hypsibius exemplaris]|uniref:hydroxyacylglutathione hydrolase n=1 Tax=Hypsibius exemplaris TaxID=2072580 RepID=A0A9X6NCV1_HYPEX|nr:Hydroxyacylglutathione hydrolase, mitochondrial [Hypsibius exemplaris]